MAIKTLPCAINQRVHYLCSHVVVYPAVLHLGSESAQSNLPGRGSDVTIIDQAVETSVDKVDAHMSSKTDEALNSGVVKT